MPCWFFGHLWFFFRLKFRIKGHLFTSHWTTKVPIVLYFVLQKILTHVKQVIRSKWPCTSSHKLNRSKLLTLAFKLDATYFHINCRPSLCLSYNLHQLQPFVLGSYMYAIWISNWGVELWSFSDWRCKASEFLSTIKAKRGTKTYNKQVCRAQCKVHFCFTLMSKINAKAF